MLVGIEDVKKIFNMLPHRIEQMRSADCFVGKGGSTTLSTNPQGQPLLHLFTIIIKNKKIKKGNMNLPIFLERILLCGVSCFLHFTGITKVKHFLFFQEMIRR